MEEAFSIFDIDGDSKITADELKIVLEAIGNKVSLIEANEMIKKVDVDNTGEIELPEFLELMAD